MKKIINPWKDVEGYNCFGCAPHNEAGVKMEFFEDGGEIVSIWQPRPEYQGWLNTLHGGIQAVLLDEICAWVILRKLQTTGVTSKMETRYRNPFLPSMSALCCVHLSKSIGATSYWYRHKYTMPPANFAPRPFAHTLLSPRKRHRKRWLSPRAMSSPRR